MVGTSTAGKKQSNEALGHAYSVLGAYVVRLENGDQVKLIHYFNPWHFEFWDTNPWGDKSPLWTDYVKSQVPYVDGNDGQVFSTIDDYLNNFGETSWAEFMKIMIFHLLTFL